MLKPRHNLPMGELWRLRLGGVVLVLGALALAIPLLPGLHASAGFLLYHFFWPILFFTAGFQDRMSWVVLAATGGLSFFGWINGTSVNQWIATLAAGMLAVLWMLDRMLDRILDRAADSRFVAILAGKRGGAILAVPVAIIMYGNGLDGYAGGQSALLACGSMYFLAGALFKRRGELTRGLGWRWRIRLAIVLVFSLLLAVAHNRLSQRSAMLVPVEFWRRALYCASYALLGWRWCYAMFGWAIGATGRELAQKERAYSTSQG